MTVIFATLPWWETPPLVSFPRGARGLCYIPYQGWKDGVWHDGPLVRLNEGGNVMACVAKGGAARLTAPLDSLPGVAFATCAAWLDEREGEVAKISLTHALQARYGEVSQAALEFSTQDVHEAVLCTLLRRAYPHATLAARNVAPTPPWRRLLQNLGILHGRAPLPPGPMVSMALSDLRDLLPAHCLSSILQALQRPSGLIPPRLLDEARSAPVL